jgi:ParB-like chromosome segregation protein Spo0J
MNIIEKKLKDLKEYENNPRHNEGAIDAVASSIKEFGFKVPIIIDGNGIIIAGHTRKKAAEKLGLKTVPCIVADDLTPEQARAFRLADNKVGELADWDFEKLEAELIAMEADFNMEDFGFDMSIFNDDAKEKEKRESIDFNESISVIVECENDEEAEKLFTQLSEGGYKCHISTL